MQTHYDVEMLMHRKWVTHHHCPVALEQSVLGGAGINVNPFVLFFLLIGGLHVRDPLPRPILQSVSVADWLAAHSCS